MDDSPLLDHMHTQVLGLRQGRLYSLLPPGGDQTEQECTISISGPYGRREAQCGLCAHGKPVVTGPFGVSGRQTVDRTESGEVEIGSDRAVLKRAWQ